VAEVVIGYQVDKHGVRRPLKTDESRRTVEIPRQLAVMLAAFKLRNGASTESFVFATGSGRPFGQRNVIRALRAAQTRATDEHDRPTFPILHERDEHGEPFRHSAASEAIAAGGSAEEVAWQLGHRDSNVTRAVYVQEVKTAERTARRRAAMEKRYGSMLGSAMEAQDGSGRQEDQSRIAEIVPESSTGQ
jgi:integrase